MPGSSRFQRLDDNGDGDAPADASGHEVPHAPSQSSGRAGAPASTSSWSTEPSEPWHNLVAFWLCGLLNNFSYVVMLSAAETIVSGEAGAVLMADIVPTLLVKLTAPFWAHKFRFATRVWICGVLSIASFYVVALSEPLSMRLFGVCIASLASGWGEVTFLSATTFFTPAVVTAWSSGTGFAGIAGAAWFFLFNSVFDVSPKTTLAIGGALPVMYILSYVYLLRKPAEMLQRGTGGGGAGAGHRAGEAGGSSAPSLEMTSVSLAAGNSDASGSAERSSKGAGGDSNIGAHFGDDSGGGGGPALTETMTARERLSHLWPLRAVMFPLFVVYFGEYTINSGISSTQTFGNYDREHFYQLAGLTYQVGVFLSRSSGSWFPIDRLWPMPVLQWLNLAVLAGQSLFHWSRTIWPVLAIVLWEGLLGGAVYVNGFRLLRVQTRPELREFSLGAASVADTIGIVCASVASIFVECALNKHNGVSTAACE